MTADILSLENTDYHTVYQAAFSTLFLARKFL